MDVIEEEPATTSSSTRGHFTNSTISSVESFACQGLLLTSGSWEAII